MKCPKCAKEMNNMGNLSWVVYASYPPQRDEVYVCEECKCKKNERVHGYVPQQKNYSSYETL